MRGVHEAQPRRPRRRRCEGVELDARRRTRKPRQRRRPRAARSQPRLDARSTADVAGSAAPPSGPARSPSGLTRAATAHADRSGDRDLAPAVRVPRAARFPPRHRRGRPGAPPPNVTPGGRDGADRSRAGPWRRLARARRASPAPPAFRLAAGTGAPGRGDRLRARATPPSRGRRHAPTCSGDRALDAPQAPAGSGVSPSFRASVLNPRVPIRAGREPHRPSRRPPRRQYRRPRRRTQLIRDSGRRSHRCASRAWRARPEHSFTSSAYESDGPSPANAAAICVSSSPCSEGRRPASGRQIARPECRSLRRRDREERPDGDRSGTRTASTSATRRRRRSARCQSRAIGPLEDELGVERDIGRRGQPADDGVGQRLGAIDPGCDSHELRSGHGLGDRDRLRLGQPVADDPRDAVGAVDDGQRLRLGGDECRVQAGTRDDLAFQLERCPRWPSRALSKKASPWAPRTRP